MTNGLTDEAIAAYAAELLDIEADIEARQDDKKAVYANIRDAYGKRSADALKLAIKRHRMESDKLAAAEELDAEAERFLGVIRSPRAPRATRVREIIEEFPDHDPETGEVGEEDRHPIPEHTTAPDAPASEGAADDAPLPPRSNVETFATRTHNPATHFLNAKGLERLHGCLRPEACAGSHQALCFSCSVQKQDGEAA